MLCGATIIMLLPIIGVITAYFSAFITVSKDYSAEATVGVISHRGFPIWFIGSADGISIMGSWHLERFTYNIYFWIVCYAALALLIFLRRKHRMKMNGSNKALQAIGDKSPQPER